MSKNHFCKNEELCRGDFLVSNNGNHKAFFQVSNSEYLSIKTWVTESDTAGSDVYHLWLQEDCNLVMYNKAHTPRWHTNSSKGSCTACRVQLTDDGHLVVSKGNKDVWNSSKRKPGM
uniref:Bulb-type lectin domain-containing protein n=1 Tax=Anabas testudineus TaxID=64144 RepID=A0A3Q1IDN6_ANATE